MALTLKDLLPSGQTVISVGYTDPVDSALEKMQRHKFSQMPVIDHEERCVGDVITYASVLRGVRSLASVTNTMQVKDVSRRVRPLPEDADLISTLDDIQRDDFAIIIDGEKKLVGIVTTSDTTTFFREYAEDLMLIEGIEATIKDLITNLYEADESGLKDAISAVADRTGQIRKKLPKVIDGYLKKLGLTPPVNSPARESAIEDAEKRLGLNSVPKGFTDLSFDEFINVLLKHPNAPKLDGGNDTQEVRLMLERVRHCRNKLAHFRGELTADERDHVKYTLGWLERNLPNLPAEDAITKSMNETSHAKHARVELALVSAALVSGEYRKLVESAGEDTTPSGSYAKLSEYLRNLSNDETSVTLTFEQIADILQKRLPDSAMEYRAWWSNQEDNPQANAWLKQSWKTQAVSMSEKRLTFVRTNERQDAYISFFSRVRKILGKSKAFKLRSGGPQGLNWDPLVYLDPGGSASIIAVFGRKRRFRIELYLDDGEAETTQGTFERLLERKESIEQELGFPVEWQSLHTKRACRIAISTDGGIPADVDNEDLHDWAAKHAVAFYRVFEPEFAAKTKLNSSGLDS